VRIPYNDFSGLQSNDDIVKNAEIKEQILFEDKDGEGSWCPIMGACNGSAMRGVVCVIDKDEQRFKIIDVDDDEAGRNTEMFQ
jgi:hypothetical protein